MPLEDSYRRQVELLVKALPSVALEPCFAIKGGTAINLFVRDDMPRLSLNPRCRGARTRQEPRPLRDRAGHDTKPRSHGRRWGKLFRAPTSTDARRQHGSIDAHASALMSTRVCGGDTTRHRRCVAGHGRCTTGFAIPQLRQDHDGMGFGSGPP